MESTRATASLSVIIPAYNRATLIGESLRSLLAQTLPADEIIVVDDGSTDDTSAVAGSFGPPVRVIRQPNRGPGAARNVGFLASTGKYIHFFDSDDLAAVNKHEVQVRALEEGDADIAYCPWIRGWFIGNHFEVDNHVLQQKGLPQQRNLVRSLLTNWSIVPHAALFRREIVERVHGFPEHLFVGEDQYMFLRCLLAGAKVVHTPGTLQIYRLGDTSKITESADNALRRQLDWAMFLIQAGEYCQSMGVDPHRWFGYRRRLWEAHQDLQQLGLDTQDIQRKLRHFNLYPAAARRYHWHRQIERWCGGLQWRITGGRAHPDFRIGKIQPFQTDLLAGLGYTLTRRTRAS